MSVCVTPPADAVRVTVNAATTGAAVAVKAALVEPAGTATEPGTLSKVLLLAKLTTVELVAAALRYTEHGSVVVPSNDCVPQATLVRVGVTACTG